MNWGEDHNNLDFILELVICNEIRSGATYALIFQSLGESDVIFMCKHILCGNRAFRILFRP